VKAENAALAARDPDQFATTHWSVVLHADPACADQNGNGPLTQLCCTYWRPIFAFICRRGYPVSDAQDLTQDFFVMILKGNLLKLADPSRG